MLVLVGDLSWVALVAGVATCMHDDHLTGVVSRLIFLFVPICDRRLDNCSTTDQLLEFLDTLLIIELVWYHSPSEEILIR